MFYKKLKEENKILKAEKVFLLDLLKNAQKARERDLELIDRMIVIQENILKKGDAK